jgi:hypothetical protein
MAAKDILVTLLEFDCSADEQILRHVERRTNEQLQYEFRSPG